MLQRLLSFWLASLVDRLKVMLIPLIMLLMPLVHAAPPLVRWRTRRKIYLWNSVLREIDQRVVGGLSLSELKNAKGSLNSQIRPTSPSRAATPSFCSSSKDDQIKKETGYNNR